MSEEIRRVGELRSTMVHSELLRNGSPPPVATVTRTGHRRGRGRRARGRERGPCAGHQGWTCWGSGVKGYRTTALDGAAEKSGSRFGAPRPYTGSDPVSASSIRRGAPEPPQPVSGIGAYRPSGTAGTASPLMGGSRAGDPG